MLARPRRIAQAVAGIQSISRRLSPVNLSSPRASLLRAHNMSTDEDYASFLDKANQDTGSSKPNPSQKKDTKFAATKAVDTDVPQPLQSLGDSAYYISDSDEPFEAVALKHNGKELDKRNFASLINTDASSVEATDVKRWNKSGQYDSIVNAVQKCSDGIHVIKVFRVDHGGTRCEYYVVVQDKDGNVVGVKAKAVES